MKKISVPGSKSITNRVLLLAALGARPVCLYNILESDDSRYMRGALENFGVLFEPLGKNSVKVIPPEKGLKINTLEPLFIGNAGTAARFLSALSLVVSGNYQLTGVDRMKERPQQDLFLALKTLGVRIEEQEKEGFLPALFTGCMGESADTISISGKISSQFLSGLLLVAPLLKKSLTINVTDAIPSLPYVQMTVDILRLWGVQIEVTEDWTKFTIFPGINSPKEFYVPSDMSSASYPIAWSLLSGKSILIENFGAKTFQGDEGFLSIAEKMGGQVKRDGDIMQLMPPQKLLSMGDFDWEKMPDVSMTGMILACFVDGVSEFRGLESLRVKECDRIVAMEQLRLLGVKIEVEGDIMSVYGDSFRKFDVNRIEIDSYDDHRIAMCFGVLRSIFKLDQLTISDPHCVAKTWPDFWLALADWNDELRRVSAVVLQNDDKYLIVKKPRKDNAWQFPQGGVDEGENAKQAALRELKEECGINLSVKFLGERGVGSYSYLFPENFKRHQIEKGWKMFLGARVEFFKAKYLEGGVEPDGIEIIDYKWVKKDQFKDYFEGAYLETIQEFV